MEIERKDSKERIRAAEQAKNERETRRFVTVVHVCLMSSKIREDKVRKQQQEQEAKDEKQREIDAQKQAQEEHIKYVTVRMAV